MRQIKRWKLPTLSTGERNLESIMNDAGKKSNSGQLVRILSLPARFEFGAFSNLHGFKSGRAFADHLKKARSENFGHLGNAFLRKLVNDSRDFSNQLNEYLETFSSLGRSSLEQRGASSFALIAFAGELAIEYVLVAWPQGSVIESSIQAFKLWQEEQSSELTENQRIQRAVENFILDHGDSRFSNIEHQSESNRMINRAGWHKDDPRSRIYMFIPKVLAEAGGYPLTRVSKALQEAGWLVDSDSDGRLTKKTRIPHGKPTNLYHVCPRDLPE